MPATAQRIDPLPRKRLVRENGPLYQQLVDELRNLIASGQVEVGSDLPKEAEIGERLGVSLITVRRALKELEDLGMVKKRSAKPALVTARAPTAPAGYRFGTYDDIVELNRGARLDVLSYGKERGVAIERHFGLPKGGHGYCLRAVMLTRNETRSLVTTFLPPDIGSQLTAEDFIDSIIFRNVVRRTGVRYLRALVTLRAAIATSSEAAILAMEPGNPVLRKEMVFLGERERTVQVSVIVAAAENAMLSYDFPLEETGLPDAG